MYNTTVYTSWFSKFRNSNIFTRENTNVRQVVFFYLPLISTSAEPHIFPTSKRSQSFGSQSYCSLVLNTRSETSRYCRKAEQTPVITINILKYNGLDTSTLRMFHARCATHSEKRCERFPVAQQFPPAGYLPHVIAPTTKPWAATRMWIRWSDIFMSPLCFNLYSP